MPLDIKCILRLFPVSNKLHHSKLGLKKKFKSGTEGRTECFTGYKEKYALIH
jgi:hypothetical protein